MNGQDFRDSLARLGLSQAEAARLLGVKLRTVQRWAAGRPTVGEPAAQALRAWCRLAERGIAWRSDGDPVEVEDLIGLAQRRRAALGLREIQHPGTGQRGGWRRRWRINIDRCRATSTTMVVHFNRLADGSFLPASYRRLDGPSQMPSDRALLEEAIAVFLETAARMSAGAARRAARSILAAASPYPARRGARLMSAGGEELLRRDSWLRPASGIGDGGFDSLSARLETALAQAPVWIIDSQTLFRRGLALLLRSWNPGIAILDAPDIASALAGLGPGPALLLVDVLQAGQGHFAGLARLIAGAPSALVVLLAAEVEWRTAAKAVALGARGYVPKSASEAVLRHALGLVASGEVYLPREVLTRWTEHRPEPQPRLDDGAPVAAVGARLTPRQSEVLMQLTLGLSNKEIARSLGLLESTVKVHVKTILKKLPAANRTQAAMLALEKGLARRPGS